MVFSPKPTQDVEKKNKKKQLDTSQITGGGSDAVNTFSPMLTCSCIIFFSLWLLKTDYRRYLQGAIIKQSSISNLWIK